MNSMAPDFSVCQRVLSSRWMIPILRAAETARRFGEIQTSLGELSRGVLAAQLRELQSMGLMIQDNYHCFPPRVEYHISDKGKKLIAILALLPPMERDSEKTSPA